VESDHVVAHEVCVTGIDQDANAICQELRDERSAVVHTIALEHERLVNIQVAAYNLDYSNQPR
jgi:hypothetical protein